MEDMEGSKEGGGPSLLPSMSDRMQYNTGYEIMHTDFKG